MRNLFEQQDDARSGVMQRSKSIALSTTEEALRLFASESKILISMADIASQSLTNELLTYASKALSSFDMQSSSDAESMSWRKARPSRCEAKDHPHDVYTCFLYCPS